MNELSIYECGAILEELAMEAEKNDGEVPESVIEAIVKLNTQSIEKMGKLVGFMSFCGNYSTMCKAEEARIAAKRKTIENRLQSVKKYLTPYIVEHGKQTVGTHTLSLRKSEAVVLEPEFNNKDYGEDVTTFKPDKKKIKAFLKDNPDLTIWGVTLEKRQNLQFK